MNHGPPCVGVELERYKWLCRLRQTWLAELEPLASSLQRPASHCYAFWLYDAGVTHWPLLPPEPHPPCASADADDASLSRHESPGAKRMRVVGGLGADTVARLWVTMEHALGAARTDVQWCMEHREAYQGVGVRMQWSAKKGRIVLHSLLRGGASARLSVRVGHWSKLYRLWMAHSGIKAKDAGVGGGGGGDGGEDTLLARVQAEGHVDTCDDRVASVLCLLLRYTGLHCTGHQAALPTELFRTLQREWGVSMECFASPLNCHWSRFCSAYPDVDRCFGSLGSFFDWEPKKGSFEANPPFIPSLIWSMLKRMNRLLSNTNEPLCFVVIVAAWPEEPAWQALHACSWVRAAARVDQAAHAYRDGAQHSRTGQHTVRIATCDSSLLVLQNEAGTRQWPVNALSGNRVLQAWASGLSREADTWEQACRRAAVASGSNHKVITAKPDVTCSSQPVTTTPHKRPRKKHESKKRTKKEGSSRRKKSTKKGRRRM